MQHSRQLNISSQKLLIISLFFPILLLAAGSEEFGDYLFSKQYYYRAITEYERAAFKNYKPKLTYKIARAYYYGKQYDEANSKTNAILMNKNLAPSLRKQILFLKSRSLLQLGEFETARAVLNEINIKASSKIFAGKAAFLKAHTHLFVNDADPAKNILMSLKNDHLYGEKSKSILKIMNEPPKTKSPYLAAIFSIVPGLGQLYTGHYKVALVSFIANGAFAYFTYSAYRRAKDISDYGYSDTIGWGFLSAIFYTGNIYNAARLAKDRNDRAYKTYYEKIEVHGYKEILDE